MCSVPTPCTVFAPSAASGDPGFAFVAAGWGAEVAGSGCGCGGCGEGGCRCVRGGRGCGGGGGVFELLSEITCVS